MMKYVFTMLAAAIAPYGAAGTAQAQAKKPNIVVIMTDAVRLEYRRLPPLRQTALLWRIMSNPPELH
jgi:hypothetical protein